MASAFCDDGFLVLLGDEVTGFVAEARLPTWARMALIHYPDSAFARGESQ